MRNNFYSSVNSCLKKLTGVVSTAGWCFSLSWKASKRYTLIRITIEILSPLLTIAATYTGKYLFDLLAGEWIVDDIYGVLILLFSFLFLIALLRLGSQKANQYCQTMSDEILSGKISLMLMEHSLAADLEYFDNPEYYDKLKATSRDSLAVTSILWNSLTSVSACVSFIVAFSAFAQTNPLYGLVMILASFPSAIVAARYTKMLYELSLDQLNGMRKMGYYQGIAAEKNYAQDMRLFNAGEILKTRYQRIWNEFFDKRKAPVKKRSVLTALLDGLPEVVIIWIGVDIAFKIIRGNGTVGDYSLYMGLAGQLLSAISLLAYSTMQIYDNQLKIENIKGLSKFTNRVMDTGKMKLSQVDSIEFVHVSFTYPCCKEPVLNDISFLLSKGSRTAIVGLNGSGKSTLIKLLLRMYDLDKGMIRINGFDIREYQLMELRANFSVYFQDMQNYSFSLRENFTIADDMGDNTDASIIAAMNAACCNDILDRSSNNLDKGVTRYFEMEGIELSGGQHQKLALARTFYRRHTVLVLDEPSSNLDPKAEHDIFETLNRLTANKLTIFTSHRLSNVSLADRIIVLEKGRVVEDGTQPELLRSKSRYAELFRYQQEKYGVSTKTVTIDADSFDR